MDTKKLLDVDKKMVWHPYSAFASDVPIYPVKRAEGVYIELTDGRRLIDGMASWWCVIHGYNHPDINAQLVNQLDKMAHVMFGGLTHTPAVELAARLVALTPQPLEAVFFSDSGSVAVEIALKLALQYWQARGETRRQQFVSLSSAYHGDTLGAMSVCDPVTGLHTLFNGILPRQLFVSRPPCRFGEPCQAKDLKPLEQTLAAHQGEIAALIMEPIVQGAGGMWFYSAEYLHRARMLCDRYQVLLILDEVATGFGRTGKLFACEHAEVNPDIMCVGKALTGGYLSLAATLTTETLHQTIDGSSPGVLMHGPTFMANPLACTAALTSITLLLDTPWQARVAGIESKLIEGLKDLADLPHVSDVRALGAIGVVELHQPVDMKTVVPRFVEAGVWIRPFGRLIYLMPPYIIQDEELKKLTDAICDVVKAIEN